MPNKELSKLNSKKTTQLKYVQKTYDISTMIMYRWQTARKKMFTIITIREIKIKTTIKQHYTPIRMAKIKKF